MVNKTSSSEAATAVWDHPLPIVWTRTGSVFMLSISFFLIGFGSSICCAQVTTTFTEPYERIEVSAAELGIVESVEVRVGDTVTKDQLLGQLDSSVLRESRRLAQHRADSSARVDAARADLKLKQGMYENLQPLLRSGHANPTEVDRSKTEYEQAQAALRIAGDEMIEAKIELARIDAQIRRRQIRSPINGIVVDIHRRPGEYLPSTGPQFATVVDISKLRVRFFVSTRFSQQLHDGQPIDVLIGTEKLRTTATIDFVSPITDSQSGTVRLDLVINNGKRKLRSGVVCQLADAAEARDPDFVNSLRAARLPWKAD